MAQVRGSQQTPEDRDLNDRDLLLTRLMIRENTSWVVTCHNGHITGVQRIGPALHPQEVPSWWLQYFIANGIGFGS